MAAERRKLERKYLIVYSRVFDRRKGNVIGYLGDLTPQGAMIIGEHRIEPGTMMDLRMDLPEQLELRHDHLDLGARTIWCEPDVDPRFVNVGFHFSELTDEEIRVIELLMSLYEFRHEVEDYPPTFTELEDEK
jgi:hypothetical protein